MTTDQKIAQAQGLSSRFIFVAILAAVVAACFGFLVIHLSDVPNQPLWFMLLMDIPIAFFATAAGIMIANGIFRVKLDSGE